PAPSGDARQYAAGSLRVITQRLRVVGRDVAGRDRVHVDPTRGPLVGEGLCEPTDSGFRGRVPRHIDATLEREKARGEDDLAAAALEHGASEQLREHELARQVDLEHAI